LTFRKLPSVFKQPPLNAEVTVNSAKETPDASAAKVWAKLKELGLISL